MKRKWNYVVTDTMIGENFRFSDGYRAELIRLPLFATLVLFPWLILAPDPDRPMAINWIMYGGSIGGLIFFRHLMTRFRIRNAWYTLSEQDRTVSVEIRENTFAMKSKSGVSADLPFAACSAAVQMKTGILLSFGKRTLYVPESVEIPDQIAALPVKLRSPRWYVLKSIPVDLALGTIVAISFMMKIAPL